MKRSVLFGLALVAVFAALITMDNIGVIFAQTDQASTNGYKIGIVDVQKVVDGYKKASEEVAKLNEIAKKKNEELSQEQKALQKEFNDFNAKLDSLSEDEQAKRKSELTKKGIDLDAKVKQARSEMQAKQQALKQSILRDIVNAVDTIGAQEHFHLILEADPETRTGVLYYASPLDITSKVITYLNTHMSK